jgi:Cu/Ag efflux pump CusA
MRYGTYESTFELEGRQVALIFADGNSSYLARGRLDERLLLIVLAFPHGR